MANETRFMVEMVPTWWWRWHFVISMPDGCLRSDRPSWGYMRTYQRATEIAIQFQEARRG